MSISEVLIIEIGGIKMKGISKNLTPFIAEIIIVSILN